ncbi:MAG: hypothetical protein LBH77_02490 [Tannerella sp.]|nr:hypothetical protein [Tannerella sp.]
MKRSPSRHSGCSGEKNLFKCPAGKFKQVLGEEVRVTTGHRGGVTFFCVQPLSLRTISTPRGKGFKSNKASPSVFCTR